MKNMSKRTEAVKASLLIALSMAVTAASLIAFSAPRYAHAQMSTDACRGGASLALAQIGDALTGGTDAEVLRVALASESRLRACRAERDSISALLVAADAYGDVNEPAKRCQALSTAKGRLAALGDASSEAIAAKALRGCR